MEKFSDEKQDTTNSFYAPSWDRPINLYERMIFNRIKRMPRHLREDALKKMMDRKSDTDKNLAGKDKSNNDQSKLQNEELPTPEQLALIRKHLKENNTTAKAVLDKIKAKEADDAQPEKMYKTSHIVQQSNYNAVNRLNYNSIQPDSHNPKAYIPIADFINYIKKVEAAYSDDTPGQILTRIRRIYYGDPEFFMLIPSAPNNIPYVSETVSRERVGSVVYEHLTAQANENAIGDNPSPYILLPNGSEVDIGHLLLSMDALLNPGSSIPYSTYEVPTIDPASWVADLGIASVWMSHHDITGRQHEKVPVTVNSPDLSTYYQISAPEADLLGDIHSFGTIAKMKDKHELSQVLTNFYIGSNSGIKTIFQTFCALNDLKYIRSGNSIEWDSTMKSSWIKRINRFNDLYAAGTWGSIKGVISGPTHKNWPYTPKVFDMFLNWLKPLLEAELH